MKRVVEVITGNDFRRMITGAYHTFVYEHENINSLNVFPVPDGDTGTNMLLTLGAVTKALAHAQDSSIGAITRLAADSAIMGARGNSGVILSQLFRGIARGLAGKDQAASSEVGKAFQYGVLYAYRSVAKPVEGTILTVAKGIAKGAHRAVRDGLSFADILEEAIAAGEEELSRTPELLPTLKTAGVVDAGGKGLIVFLKGCLDGLGGAYTGPESGMDYEPLFFPGTAKLDEVHPYCTEFIVKNSAVSITEAKRILMTMGDSLVLAEGSSGKGLLKVHIHTGRPGTVLGAAITWGTLHDIKIDNMADQHRETTLSNRKQESCGLFAPTQQKPSATISVTVGDGIEKIMREAGADILISGGQSMNPSVEDFMDAIHEGGAEKYILLPNNNNIMLAANQVKKLLPDRVEVVPSVNIPQGLAALLAYDPQKPFMDNVEQMTACISKVNAAAITQAVRDSMSGDHKVAEGAYIGVVGSHVLADAPQLGAALSALIATLLLPDSEIVTLYYGESVTNSQAEELVHDLKQRFTHVAIECYYGGQPHYHFLISVE